MASCKAVTLKDYVNVGAVVPEHFAVLDVPVPSADAVEEGGVLCRLKFFSVDPYMRVSC